MNESIIAKAVVDGKECEVEISLDEARKISDEMYIRDVKDTVEGILQCYIESIGDKDDIFAPYTVESARSTLADDDRLYEIARKTAADLKEDSALSRYFDDRLEEYVTNRMHDKQTLVTSCKTIGPF